MADQRVFLVLGKKKLCLLSNYTISWISLFVVAVIYRWVRRKQIRNQILQCNFILNYCVTLYLLSIYYLEGAVLSEQPQQQTKKSKRIANSLKGGLTYDVLEWRNSYLNHRPDHEWNEQNDTKPWDCWECSCYWIDPKEEWMINALT